jgi:hypothetical protein
MSLNDERRRQTLDEVARLKAELEAWVTFWTQKDIEGAVYPGRYKTQLSLISSEVQGALERLRETASNDTVLAKTTGEVFKAYNLHDQRLIWIRYAWDYFRSKLDQRNDDRLRPILEAADEVTWTSYSALFRSAGLEVPAAPIPYIEYDYVPSALRTGQAHVLNRKPGAEAGPLKDYFQALPVPLLRLPPGVVSSPWSLTLICHEIGHLLQSHIEPELGFFSTFAEWVSTAVKDAGASDEEQAKWSAWSQEIFADFCMALVAGPWAVWALAPWVVTTDAAMKEPLDKYPPPVVRLYLLDKVAQRAGLPAATEVLSALAVESGASSAADAVAALIDRPLPTNKKNRTLAKLLVSSPEALGKNGRVGQWATQALGKGQRLPQNDKTSARDAAVAVTKAHYLAFKTGVAMETLKANADSLIRDCHDSAVRSVSELAAPATSLSDRLFELSIEELVLATTISSER